MWFPAMTTREHNENANCFNAPNYDVITKKTVNGTVFSVEYTYECSDILAVRKSEVNH